MRNALCRVLATRAPLALVALACAPHAGAEPFQLLVTVSPPGSISNPANWQPVKRFAFSGNGASPTPLADIPAGQLADPAGIAFRTATELFVGNRHGNVLGQGSVSRLTISPDGDDVTLVGSTTAPGMVGVHEVAFNPVSGELFAACVNNGIYRFTFDGNGNPVPHGSFAGGVPMRGVAVHPNGRYIYCTSASNQIRVYRIEPNDSVTALASVFPPGASNLHFFCVHPDGVQLYVGDIDVSRVYRYRMGSGGELQFVGFTDAPAAIDIAFSPDGLEMFTGNHFGGGISRFTFNPGLDQWEPSGFITTPTMGAFAIYTPIARPCFPDFNGDGNLDPDDLSDYIACYFTPPCPAADYNADGTTDPDDLSDYIADYFFGCA